MTTPPEALSPAYVQLRCFACGSDHRRDILQTVCRECGLPLEVAIEAELKPAELRGRTASLWRYGEVLPARPADAVTLGEGATPLLPVTERDFIKDESQNPTGSFKARGMAMAVTMAKRLGAPALRAPSAGNAAGALSAYGAAAGLDVVVAMPEDTPRTFVEECRHYGATVHLVPGTIADAGKFLAQNGPQDAFDISTLKEPFRVEGKKTMAYELYEDLGGRLPDVIVYPAGGGTGLVGMWKAFGEMQRMGWIDDERPKLVAVQAAGCAPIVKGLEAGSETTEFWQAAHTRAWGLRVPGPIGGFLCLRAIRETSGTAVAIGEEQIFRAGQALAARTGIDVCPEGGAAWQALCQLRESGFIAAEETAVVFNTGTGLKYRPVD